MTYNAIRDYNTAVAMKIDLKRIISTDTMIDVSSEDLVTLATTLAGLGWRR